MRTSDNPSSHRIITLPMRNKREPTSGLEPLTCSLGVIGQALQGFAYPALGKGFLFPYCPLLQGNACRLGSN
jgi:hypothetical protein